MVSAIKGMGSSPRRKKHHAGNELQLSLLTPGLEKEKNHPQRLGRVSGIALPALPGNEESGLSFSEKPRRDGSPGNGDREVVGLPGRARKMEAMGTLASGIAHDFNNILTPIFLRIEMAMAQLQQDSPLRYQLEQVLTCGQRARDLVQQILNFSHQNDGERRPLQISLVVKEMVKLLRSSLPASIEIRQDIRGAGMVLADLGLIHVLVIELCIRSAHAMRGNGGFLEISLCDVELDGPGDRDLLSLPRGAYVKLSVKQTINGTPREKQRADAETDEETGPDIALIRSIVEQHGGKMVVYKKAGEGVTIHTFLPRM
jgi:two-component system, cell cycle sensor histidine kinase and response regulator CckA